MKTKVEVIKCQCGDNICTTYGTSNGYFNNGNGYSLKEAEIACEAFNIHNQNGLTPNELLNQRNELLEACESLSKQIEMNDYQTSDGLHDLKMNKAYQDMLKAIKKPTT